MSVLIMNAENDAAIRAAVKAARKAPLPWEELQVIADSPPTDHLDLADRKDGVEELRRKYPSQHVVLGTYHCAISFEQQPAGLFRHLSVSSANKSKVPGMEVMTVIAEAFGFSSFPPSRPNRIWAEEFAPGHRAVNVIELEIVQ